MNWMKVKIILIIFFLIINALLVGILVSRNLDTVPNSESISHDVYDILKARNITVDRQIIDTSYGLAKAADAYPVSSEESDFLSNLISKSEKDENGNFIYNGSVIGIFDNLVHFESVDKKYNDAEAYFESVGFDFKDAYPVSSEGTETDGTVIYLEKIDGLEVFGAKATVKISSGKVSSADVVWYEITEGHSKNTKTISIADALLDFAADKSRGNKPCTVSQATRGFSVDAGTENASVSQVIPCIRITTDIGSSFYYDARSPEQ